MAPKKKVKGPGGQATGAVHHLEAAFRELRHKDPFNFLQQSVMAAAQQCGEAQMNDPILAKMKNMIGPILQKKLGTLGDLEEADLEEVALWHDDKPGVPSLLRLEDDLKAAYGIAEEPGMYLVEGKRTSKKEFTKLLSLP